MRTLPCLSITENSGILFVPRRNMPSKEEESSQRKGFLDVAADMEELVAAIKHNLRLKSRSLCSNKKRVSPYEVPRTLACKQPKQHAKDCQCAKPAKSKLVAESDDPYEMLQILIREGGLIKEAVKRLRLEEGQKEGEGATAHPNKDRSIDFYEYECSICDLPAVANNSLARTLEL